MGEGSERGKCWDLPLSWETLGKEQTQKVGRNDNEPNLEPVEFEA